LEHYVVRREHVLEEHIGPEDGCDTFFQNVELSLNYTVFQPRGPYSSSSPLRDPQMQQPFKYIYLLITEQCFRLYTLNDWIKMNNELARMWKEAVMAQFKVLFQLCPSKTTKYLSNGNLWPCQDSN
jgi:hypothetical protein